MMKKLVVALGFFFGCWSAQAQDFNELLAAGVADAQRYTSDYLAPATEGLMYSMNNGWFNSGKTHKILGFEISIIGNVTTYGDDKESFVLDTADYENLQFRSGNSSEIVSTSLGSRDGVRAFVTYQDPITGFDEEVEFELPSGLGAEGISFIPTAFLQASLGVFKNTDIIARYVPKIKTDEVETGLFGAGLQHEFTGWVPAGKVLPIRVSGLVAYTKLNGSYDFTASNIVQGENQQIEIDASTWLFQLIASTNIKVINFYGGIGYVTGNSTTDLTGTYRIQQGVLASQTLVDPFSVESDISGVRGTLGANLKLGIFGLNVDYSIGDFNNISVGLNFGVR